jgi:hypothetical protein
MRLVGDRRLWMLSVKRLVMRWTCGLQASDASVEMEIDR